MQVVAWYVNAKRYAVGGSGPEWFLSRAAWAPSAGWWTAPRSHARRRLPRRGSPQDKRLVRKTMDVPRAISAAVF
jgi:hypothetical protein